MNKVLNISKPILITVAGILLANIFNIFDYIKIIPSSISFEVCITTYFSVLDYLWSHYYKVFEDKFFTNISCIFYIDEENINQSPLIKFTKEDVCEIKCSITVQGNNESLSKSRITILFPEWIDAQPKSNKGLIEYDYTNKQCVININKLVHKNSKSVINASAIITIPMISKPCEEELSIEIESNFANENNKFKKLMCNYKSNKFKILNYKH